MSKRTRRLTSTNLAAAGAALVTLIALPPRKKAGSRARARTRGALSPVRPIVDSGFEDDLVRHAERAEIPVEERQNLGDPVLVFGAAARVEERRARREPRIVEEHGVEIVLPEDVLDGIAAERALERRPDEERHRLDGR